MKVTGIIKEVYDIDEGEYRILIDVDDLKSALLCSVFLGSFEEGLSLIGKKISGFLSVSYGFTFIGNFDDKKIYFENNISTAAADHGQDSHCRLSGYVVGFPSIETYPGFPSIEMYPKIIRVQSVYAIDIAIDLVSKDGVDIIGTPIDELLKIGAFIKATGYLEFEIDLEHSHP